jgi:hypothetical protein
MKEVRLCFMKYLEGNPLNINDRVALLPNGLPKVFSPVIISAIQEGSTGDLRIILTILNATRALSFGEGCDIESIVKPLNKGESYDSLIKDFDKHALSF